MVHVLTVLRSIEHERVRAMFGIYDSETPAAIFAVRDIVPRHIHRIQYRREARWPFQLKGIKLSAERNKAAITSLIQFGQLLAILLFRVRFVEDVIFLVPQPHTPKTILTISAVQKKSGVHATNTVLRVRKIIRLVAIHALGAEVVVPCDRTGHAILIADDLWSEVVTILAIPDTETEVAVFGVQGMIAIIAVHRSFVH